MADKEQSDEQAGSLVRLLSDRGLTLATAESCTGGLVGGLITAVPGSSGVYVGGWVTYADRMKVSQLGVRAGLIESEGAVSRAVAEAMARGAIENSGADVSVAVTGVAGPGGDPGGDPGCGPGGKPVGTVWLGFGCGGSKVRLPVVAARCLFGGGRGAVRGLAAVTAVRALRLLLLGEPIDRLGGVESVVDRGS